MGDDKQNPPSGTPLLDGGLNSNDTKTSIAESLIPYKSERRLMQVFDDQNIDRTTIIVTLLALAKEMGHGDECSITLVELAQRVRVTPTTVKSALLAAQRLGYINIHSKAVPVPGARNTSTANLYEATTMWFGSAPPNYED